MESDSFVIDVWTPYHKNENVCKVFTLYGKKYCIRKIDSWEWGQPIFDEKDIEDDYTSYRIYSTLEEVEAYIRELKQAEGVII